MIGVKLKALFKEYSPPTILCGVVYSGFIMDLYELDKDLTVKAYSKLGLVDNDGHALSYNVGGVKSFLSSMEI